MLSLLIGLFTAAGYILTGSDPGVSVDFGITVAWWCGLIFSCLLAPFWLILMIIFLLADQEDEATQSGAWLVGGSLNSVAFLLGLWLIDATVTPTGINSYITLGVGSVLVLWNLYSNTCMSKASYKVFNKKG